MNDTDGRLYVMRCGLCLRSFIGADPKVAVDAYKSSAHLRGCHAPTWRLVVVDHPDLSGVVIAVQQHDPRRF